MSLKKIFFIGSVTGLVFGCVLFIGGAITGRIVYGAQMAPAGKFTPDQMNAFYFIWTKLVIGVFFGILFLFVYEKLPLRQKIQNIWQGIIYGFVFWLIMSLWNLSHPLVYESMNFTHQLFWLLYTLWGFLAYGGTIGYFYQRSHQKP